MTVPDALSGALFHPSNTPNPTPSFTTPLSTKPTPIQNNTTNAPRSVKFWIIKNYMSPHHRAVIPAMAAKYGFDYAFVTYRWPHWLHRQTDKQRIIWCGGVCAVCA